MNMNTNIKYGISDKLEKQFQSYTTIWNYASGSTVHGLLMSIIYPLHYSYISMEYSSDSRDVARKEIEQDMIGIQDTLASKSSSSSSSSSSSISSSVTKIMTTAIDLTHSKSQSITDTALSKY
jgi:hypothetical protein